MPEREGIEKKEGLFWRVTAIIRKGLGLWNALYYKRRKNCFWSKYDNITTGSFKYLKVIFAVMININVGNFRMG